MQKTHLQHITILISLIFFGALSRYLLVSTGLQPFPNFELIMAATLLAILLLPTTIAFLVPLASMILSDILLGNSILTGSAMNQIVLFTYSGFALIALINTALKKTSQRRLTTISIKNTSYAIGLGVGLVLVYDLWTNMGWWYLIYPHTPATFTAVMTAGIPFMIYHMISGIVSTTLIVLPLYTLIKNKQLLSLPKIINMPKKTTFLPVGLAVLMLISLSFVGGSAQISQHHELWLEHNDATSVTVIFQSDEWTIKQNVVALPDETAYSITERVLNTNQISFKTTYYEEYDSLLVDSINGIINGEDNAYWQFWVDGELPMIGANNYKINNGQTIEWLFESVPT